MQRSARIDLIKTGNRTRAIVRRHEGEAQHKWRLWFLQQQQAQERKTLYIKEERQNRREDWLAGPLAPNRNRGKVRGAYGAVDSVAAAPIELPKVARNTPQRLGQHQINDDNSVAEGLAFKGRTIVGNVIENDRVVVVEGPPRIKGLVGTVKNIGKESETVLLKDINSADVKMSKLQKAYASGENKDPPLYETQELSIPMKDVRLVYDIEDPRTGQMKAVIIRHVHADGPYSARSPYSSWPSHTRYATGTGHLTENGQDIRLDWPEEIPGDIPRRLEDDTSRSNVEFASWRPEIFTSPIGYPADPVNLKGRQIEAPEGRYTAGVIPPETEVRYSSQRLGLHGFPDHATLEKRQARIAAGIMAELHGSGRVLKQDSATHLKKRIMEDARAIWWKDRQILSPAAEAARKAAEEKKQRREAQLSKLNEVNAALVVDGALLEGLQNVALKDRYKKADHRFTKRLAKQPPIPQTPQSRFSKVFSENYQSFGVARPQPHAS